MRKKTLTVISLALCLGMFSGCSNSTSVTESKGENAGATTANSSESKSDATDTSETTSAPVNSEDMMLMSFYTKLTNKAGDSGFDISRGSYGEYIELSYIDRPNKEHDKFDFNTFDDGSVSFFVNETSVTINADQSIRISDVYHGLHEIKASDRSDAAYMINFSEYEYMYDKKYTYYSTSYYDSDYHLIEYKKWNYTDKGDDSKLLFWRRYTYKDGRITKFENLVYKGKSINEVEDYIYCENGHRINPRKTLTVKSKDTECEILYDCECTYDNDGHVIDELHKYKAVTKVSDGSDIPLKNTGTVGQEFHYTYNPDGTMKTSNYDVGYGEHQASFDYYENGAVKSYSYSSKENEQLTYEFDENGNASLFISPDNKYKYYTSIAMKKNPNLMAAYRIVFNEEQVGPLASEAENYK